MMNDKRREFIRKQREAVRKSGASQPGSGEPVEAGGAGVGAPAGSAGQPLGNLPPLVELGPPQSPGGVEVGPPVRDPVPSWTEAEDALDTGAKHQSGMGQRKGKVRLTIKERLMRIVGRKAAKIVKHKLEDGKMAEPTEQPAADKQPLVVVTSGGKGTKQMILSGATLVAIIAAIRVFWPDLLWPADQDAAMIKHINNALAALVGAFTVLMWFVGAIKNVIKNRALVKNGVVLFANPPKGNNGGINMRLLFAVAAVSALLVGSAFVVGCAHLSQKMEQATGYDVLPTTLEDCNLAIALAEKDRVGIQETQAAWDKVIENDTEDKIPADVERAFSKQLEDSLTYIDKRIERINAIKSTLTPENGAT